jgi:hypothetical protein
MEGDLYQPFTTTDLLNWKHYIPSFMEKPQALIDFIQSIIQTPKHMGRLPTASSDYSILH